MPAPLINPNGQKVAINRTMVLLISITCIVASVGLWMAYPTDKDVDLWRGGFMRAGLLMSALWIALPTKKRPAAWANVSVPILLLGLGTVIFVASRPNLFRALLPAAIAVGAALMVLGRVLHALRSSDRVQRPDRSSWRDDQQR